ncbi:MAG: hypothetical protein R3B47_19895 [Bacteroidia bacterium]
MAASYAEAHSHRQRKAITATVTGSGALLNFEKHILTTFGAVHASSALNSVMSAPRRKAFLPR